MACIGWISNLHHPSALFSFHKTSIAHILPENLSRPPARAQHYLVAQWNLCSALVYWDLLLLLTSVSASQLQLGTLRDLLWTDSTCGYGLCEQSTEPSYRELFGHHRYSRARLRRLLHYDTGGATQKSTHQHRQEDWPYRTVQPWFLGRRCKHSANLVLQATIAHC